MKENQKIMASKTSGSRKLKRKNLPKFNHDIYSRISSRNLFVYSVHYLLEQEIEVRMEDIVFACFLLFPQKFALKKYPRWPDSAVVSRRMHDCRSRRYIAANTDLGIKLTAKGSRIAERVAKLLGVSTARRKVKTPPSQQKERALVTPTKEIKPVKVARVISLPPKAQVITSAWKTKIVRKKKTTSSAQLKKAQLTASHANAVIAKPVRKEKVVTPAPIGKVQTSRSKVLPATQVKKTQPSKPVVQPGKVEPTQLTLFKKISLPAPVVVPKEVKVRAGKFVHLMERSDAYIHYKKNGKNSKIGEFDFRSLLLCTMESSRETLVKNVSLFKGYASIHNRQDLITFLNHCEDRFSYLLVPPQKQLKKRSREKEFHG